MDEKEPQLTTLESFKAFAKSPGVVLGISLANAIEGMIYFGTLTLMTVFFQVNMGLSELHAGWATGIFTGGITLSQVLFGSVSDKIGVRKTLKISMVLLLIGRLFFALAEIAAPQIAALVPAVAVGVADSMLWASGIALLIVVVAYGLFQPALYAATKRYAPKETSAIAFAFLYGGMNLGGFASGLLSPPIRHRFENTVGANGISAVLIFFAAMMAISVIIVFVSLNTKYAKEKKADDVPEDAVDQKAHTKPWKDIRFMLFIFLLIPVQTLFAHQWLTIPTYLLRSYPDWVADNFEFFSNLNPLIIFVLAPIVAAMTAKVDVYKMIVLGTAIMAAPTFLLCLGEIPWLFMTFVLLSAIGEAMWQPRFFQHIADMVPADKVGAYMGFSQLPWYCTKFITASYSGYFLAEYIPAEGKQNPSFMWFVYGLIAVSTPVILLATQKWLNPKHR